MIYRTLFPLIMKTSRHLITVSEFSKNDICKKYRINYNKFTVIPCACNAIKPIIDEDLRKEKYFFAMGSMARSKNLQATLEAFEILSRKREQVKLYVGGYDSSAENFRKYGLYKYLSNPRVQLKGRLSETDMIKYYSNAIAFIYPSLGEGFGIPPLEAQNCDCPIVITNFLSLPEIYEDSGLYCDPYSPEDISKKMDMILENNNLRDYLIKKGRENRKRFSWEKSAEKLVAVIDKYMM